jgi:hypothetical protein
MADIAQRGWHPELCFIGPDPTVVPTIDRRLTGDLFDYVVVARVYACHRVGWVCSKR